MNFEPSGFFVFRTPLLPFDDFAAWGKDLLASATLGDPKRFEEAIASDRARLRERLISFVSHPEVRDVLFVASPDFVEALEVWMREPESEHGQKIETALVSYFARMAGRPTPFGLCAGYSVGTIGAETHLVIEGRERYRRHTRLDIGYLSSLCEALVADSALRETLTYRPNCSLYRAAGRIGYVESRLDERHGRSHHLVAVEETDYLAATLARAERGATIATLATALVDDDVSLTNAREYIEELIESQILLPDLAPGVTGPEPVHTLIQQTAKHAASAMVAAQLGKVPRELSALDGAGPFVQPERYREVARILEALPAKVEMSHLFQVEMIKPAPHATLGKAVIAEITRGVEILHRLVRPPRDDSLLRFREAFLKRYELREMPLLEVLDEEAGIGFDGSEESSPLLRGLSVQRVPQPTEVAWDARQTFLLQKLTEAIQSGAHEITLAPSELDSLSIEDPSPLPDAFAVTASVAAASESALARGEFRVLFDHATGPSGARTLARFCHADENLCRCVEEHLRAEEALHPEATFAEVVHLPSHRIGNIVCRPLLRAFEIPCFGHSGARSEQQIPLTDLRVSVQGARIFLRSARLGREVIPRLTTAHNFTLSTLGAYRFLCALQERGVALALVWNWGALKDAPFLPRVSVGRLVLSRARWRAGKEELQRLGKRRGAARFREAQKWRTKRRLPRLIALAEWDDLLLFDLDNVLSVEALVHLIKGRDEAFLVEMFPDADQLCAYGPEGRFLHELVVPFVRRIENSELPKEKQESKASPAAHALPRPIRRSFPPGSEWLSVKLYTGTTMADGILQDLVAPLVDNALRSGAAQRWFFLRFADPDWYVCLRLQGIPARLCAEVLPTLHTAAEPMLADGRLWRVELDTYLREVERYGGPEGIVLAEQVFHVDSEAVLKILARLEPGDAGLDERWRLMLRSADMLLGDLGCDLETRCAVVQQARRIVAQFFQDDGPLKGRIGERFRKERERLEALLDPAHDARSPLLSGLDILRERSMRLAPIVAELHAREQTGALSVPLSGLAWIYVHMHAFRLLRSALNEHEVVLYDFLARLYRSRIARAQGAKSDTHGSL